MPTILALTETGWFALASVLLFAAAASILVYGGRRTEAQENHTLVHVLVCVIAGTAYAAMATDLGTIAINPDDGAKSFDIARYADWSVTTPLLLFGLALTAMHERLSHAGLLILLIGLDVLMVLTGLFAGLQPPTATDAALFWFVLGCLFFACMLWILWGPLRRQADRRGPHVHRIYVRHAAMLSVLWTVYPVVFIIGGAGLGVISPLATIVAIVVLDVTAKGVYGLVAVHGTRQLLRARGEG